MEEKEKKNLKKKKGENPITSVSPSSSIFFMFINFLIKALR